MPEYSREYFENPDRVMFGYKGMGLQQYPQYLAIIDEILKREPESVLVINSGRGFLVKMLQQAGVTAYGVECSEYCNAVRVTNSQSVGGILPDFDLGVIVDDERENLSRNYSLCKRFLIFSDNLLPSSAPAKPTETISLEAIQKRDIGFQQSQRVSRNGQDWTIAGRFVEEDIETLSGKNGRKLVVNIGSYIVQFRSNKDICVVNTDIPKIMGLHEFASGWGANFTNYEAPSKLPFKDNSIDEINCSHMFEHLDRNEGAYFLKECLRTLKSGGRIRITVPNAGLLAEQYMHGGLDIHKIYNKEAGEAEDESAIFWHMLSSGGEHKTCYGESDLEDKLTNAGFEVSGRVDFDNLEDTQLIGQVGYDMFPEISLVVVGTKLK